MAPEQIAGLDADVRTDIFAFGAVLYEMAAGRKAFDGGSPTATIAAILSAEPSPFLASDASLPPMLERVIRACLSKAPDDRWQTARDLQRTLQWTGERDAISVAPHPRPRRTIWLAAAAAVVATIFAGWLTAQIRQPAPNLAIHRLTVLPPEGATLVPGQVPLISPDGQRIVLNVSAASGSNALYARTLDSAEAQIVPGTHEAIWPFWSPDSQSIGFFAEGKLKTIRLGELTPRVITDAPMPRGGSWSRDGVILFTKFNNDRIYRVAAAGGAVTAVTTIDRRSENAHWWPQFLPDGQRFLYFVSSSGRSDIGGVYLANLDGSRRRILEAASNGVFVQPGFLIFRQSGSLVAQPFDTTSGTLSGTPVVVAERLAAAFASREPLSLSDTGALVLLSGAGDRQLAWYTRSGVEEIVGPPGPYASAAVSKRGQVVFTRNDQILNTDDLWLLDMQRAIPTRVTSHPANDNFPMWLPTAEAIVFSSTRSGSPSLWRKTVANSAPETALFQFDRPIYPGSQTPDGLWQLFTGPSKNGDFDIGAVRLDDSRALLWPLDSEFDERRPILSPDGKWLAYSSEQSGRPEVFITEFPGPGEKIPISNGGGYEPKWRADGRELFYIAKDGQLMSVAIAPGPALEVGRSQALFPTKLDVVNLPFFWRYDVTPDGQRFLMIQPSHDRASAAATVVLNWPALLPR
jgi:Tol biopolymer transport system component